jgi:hypothetical protein
MHVLQAAISAAGDDDSFESVQKTAEVGWRASGAVFSLED